MIKYYNFPTAVFKRIEPWLVEFFDFDLELIGEELRNIHELCYDIPRLSSTNERTIAYKAKQMEKRKIVILENVPPETEIDTYEELRDKVFLISKYIEFDCRDISPEKIREDFLQRIESPTQEDEDIAYTLVFLALLYQKYKNTNGVFDAQDTFLNEDTVAYNYHVRPDLLKLYKLFHNYTTKENPTRTNWKKCPSIKIKLGKNPPVELKNFSNWFANTMTGVIQRYMEEMTLDEIEEELQTDYFPPKRPGKLRGKKGEMTLFILSGIHNLLKLSSLYQHETEVTEEEGKVVLDFLDYIGLRKNDGDDAKFIRTSLNNIVKYPIRFTWYDSIQSKNSLMLCEGFLPWRKTPELK